jgi:y4mF family transcriptional regulator
MASPNLILPFRKKVLLFPLKWLQYYCTGKNEAYMRIATVKEIGRMVRETRKSQNLTQGKLAKLCNIGTRFVSDLENGKPTCQINKALIILHGLGIELEMVYPYPENDPDHKEQTIYDDGGGLTEGDGG